MSIGIPCRNCTAPLAGRFCSACGQDSRLTLGPWRDMFAEWSDAVLGWETRTGRTLRALALEPGRLTVEYAAGRRADWLHPLRIYLSASVAAFAVFGATNAMVQARVADMVGSGDPLSTTGAMLLAVSAAMVLLLPAAAGCYALGFRGLGRYYAEHLVFTLHTTSQFLLVQAMASLVQALVVLLNGPAELLVVARVAAHLVTLGYGYAAARRVYGLGAWATVLRLGIVNALFAPLLFGTVWLMTGPG